MASTEMMAKRSHWSSSRTRLYRKDGTRLCEVRLSHSRENGVIQMGDASLKAYHEPADRTWCLLQDGVELLYAFALAGAAPCVVIERKTEDGAVETRVRIQRRPEGEGPIFEVHRYTTKWQTPAAQSGAAKGRPLTALVGSEAQSETTTSEWHEKATATASSAPHANEECELREARVVSSRDFPTPKTNHAQLGEPELCALFEAHHARKFRVELCAELDDIMLSFVFFFFLLMQRKLSDAEAQKATTVTMVRGVRN